MLPQTQRQPIFVDDATYANRYDYDGSANVVYSGWAEPGTDDEEDTWRICKFVYGTFGSETVVTQRLWADGDNKFDNVWDDRASLTYL